MAKKLGFVRAYLTSARSQYQELRARACHMQLAAFLGKRHLELIWEPITVVLTCVIKQNKTKSAAWNGTSLA